MDVRFCNFYKGNGNPPTNRYCRQCPNSRLACDTLWERVVNLSNSNYGNSVKVIGTNADLYPNPNNHDLVYLKINAQWNLSKEDFLHFVATGRAQLGRATQRQDPNTSPSLTRQEPYAQAIIGMLGGQNVPEIIAVRNIQKNQEIIQSHSFYSLRDEIVMKLEKEKFKINGPHTPEKVFKTMLINQMITMINSGKSKYATIDWLNKKSSSSGNDVKPIIKEIFLLINDYKF